MRGAMDSQHPLDMLLLVGQMIEVLMPHEFSFRERLSQERVDPNPLIDDAAAVPGPEYTAVLTLVAEMVVGDEHVQQRCRDAVAARDDVVPLWIAELANLAVGRAVRVSDTFGDLDQVLFGVQLADGREMTCAVMIDHLEFSTVKDVGIWDKSLDAVLALIDAEGLRGIPTELATADARAWIEQVFGLGIARRVRERRPGFSAVVKWLAARLPEGGQPRKSGEADRSATAEVIETFFASPEGKRFDLDEFEEALRELIARGTGDPLRWSQFRIIYALGDLPGDRDEPVQTLLRLPALMRSFVPFAHERSGIDSELTAQTLAAIDEVQKSVEDRIRRELHDYWDTAG